MQNLKEMKEKLAALKSEYMQVALVEFNNIFKPFFEKNEWLKSVAFTAYTDYFADGDPVEFSVHNDTEDLIINGEYGFDVDWLDEYTWSSGKKAPNPNYAPEKAEVIEEIASLIGEFDDEFYRETFGDHIKIIIEKDGVKTKSYTDHD